MAYKSRHYFPIKKIFLLFLFGIITIYIWSIFLNIGNLSVILPIIYLLTSYVISIGIFKKGAKLKNILKLSIGFSIIVSIMDIFFTSIFSSNLFWISIMDIPLKIIFCVSGGLLFNFLNKHFHSKRKIFFSNLGILLRRVTAAFIDFNIILMLIGLIGISMGALETLNFVEPTNEMFIVTIETVLILIYKIIYENRYGYTIGKKFVSLKVKGNLLQIILRNLNLLLFGISMFSFIGTSSAMGVIALILLVDSVLLFSGKRLFDFLANTSVK